VSVGMRCKYSQVHLPLSLDKADTIPFTARTSIGALTPPFKELKIEYKSAAIGTLGGTIIHL
jgi:hypothetical protein